MKQKKSKKITILILLALLLIAALGFGVYKYLNSDNKPTTSDDSSINYGGPTKEEQTAGDKQKEESVDQDSDRPTTPGNTPATLSVSPFVSYASQTGNIVEVNAYVNGIAEDGGTCTMTAKNGSATVTKSNPGIMNASNTNCKSFVIDRSEFIRAGTWTVAVSYASTKASGISSSSNLEIK